MELTIEEAIDKIYRREYFLPAIQREFIWKPEQIEMLFDSLMRNYPISSFLFWEVQKENVNKFQFYEFIRDFHEKKFRHNPKANLNDDSKITAILDGQQRLTSLYIGLKGSYSYKLPRKRWDNDLAFPKRFLCLNLTKKGIDEGNEYNFKFLTKEEIGNPGEGYKWFVVGDVLEFKETFEINEFIFGDEFKELGDERKFASKALGKLYRAIKDNKSINFFLEKESSLDKVLNIFIRVNSGGTQLNYSDLLLSIATAQWNKKDAREEINNLVDQINSIGNGFNINKDLVLKSSLILSGFKNIAFKVDNFNQKNMLIIEKNWEAISEAMTLAFQLVASFGYSRDTLTSNNAVIPIAYYLYENNIQYNFINSSNYEYDRKEIFKWLAVSLLKRIFSGQPDNVLRPIRDVIKENTILKGFPYKEIYEKLKKTTKSMLFNEDEIDGILDHKYGTNYAYSTLALLYPSLDFKNKFHQDHCFPKKLFSKNNLEKRGYEGKKYDFYINNFNTIGNIQLLEGTLNLEKSAILFEDWIKKLNYNEDFYESYKRRNYIPDCDLNFDNFEEFIEKRRNLMKNKLKEILSL